MKIQSKRFVIVPLGVNLLVASGILLSILLLSLGDTLEVIPFFAPLTATFLFMFFHETHDLLALVLVMYATYRYSYRLGTISILLYATARLPVAFIWLPEDTMGLLHTIVATLFTIGGIWLINELHKTEELRKLSYDTLLRAEEKYRDLYENAPVAYYSVGTDGLIKRVIKLRYFYSVTQEKNYLGKAGFSCMLRKVSQKRTCSLSSSKRVCRLTTKKWFIWQRTGTRSTGYSQ